MATARRPLVGRAAELAQFSAEGFGRRVLAETESFRVVVAALEDGQEIPVHAPAVDLVMTIVEGTGSVMAGEQAHAVRAGDVVLVPAGESRGLRARGGRLVAVNVAVPPPTADEHAARQGEWPPEPAAPDVGATVLEEHRDLLPHVEHLGALAAEAHALDEPDLRRRLASVVRFLREDLLPHAEEEERSIYPAAERVLRAVGGATRTMSIDHRFVAAMVEDLATVAGGPLAEEGRRRAQRLLHGLRALLDVHFTKENEVYVPLLDRLSPPELVELHDRLAGGGHGHHHHHGEA